MSIDDETMIRMAQTADRVEIIEVLSRYNHMIDARDWEALPTIFTEDAECGYVRVVAGEPEIFPPVLGLPAIKDWLEGSLRPVKTMHYISNHVFTVIEGDRAQTRSYLAVKGTGTGGVYEGDHVRTAEGWRVKRLTLQQDFDS